MCSVLLEDARGRELAEPVAHHVFRHEHRVKHLPVVHCEGQADEIRRNHRTPRPGLDRRLGLIRLGLGDLLQQMPVDERAFFNWASHSASKLLVLHWPAIAPDQDEPIRMLLLLARPVALRQQTPRRGELLPSAAGLRLALSATVGMINRVARYTAVDRPDTEVS